MAGRAYWNGYLKLSLVSCPVKLYSATSSTAGKISFNMLHKDTLNRVQQRYHDPELGEIDRADLVKGYQFEKDRYVVVTAEELDEISIESSKTIDIEGFVDAADVDPIYLDSPYYIAPDGPIAEETYAVILEAMKRAKKVAIARIVLSGRERLVALHQGRTRADQHERKKHKQTHTRQASKSGADHRVEGVQIRAGLLRGPL